MRKAGAETRGIALIRRLHALGMRRVEGVETEPFLRAVAEAAVELLDADSARVELCDGRAVTHGADSGAHVHAAPIVTRTGETLGTLSALRHDAREPEEEDTQILELLAQAAADVLDHARTTELLAALAHELRTPLAPMRTALDLVKHRPDDVARSARTHTILEEQLAELVRLVDDLVDVSRLSRNAIAIQPDAVDLVHVVTGVLERAVRVDSELPDAPVVVSGDPVRLAQIVSTLLDGAAHRAGDGATVRLSLRADHGAAVLAVDDDGPGLPRGGSCIGLTLVRKLAEAHGGGVVAGAGERGRGTSVVVRLPLLHVGSDAPSEVRRRRALVVDDNEDGATLLAELLIDQGVEVSTAFDGTSALAAIREFAPDVVFLDIGLPDIDGNDVARRIRATELVTQPLLVAVTGWSRAMDRVQTTGGGFDQHIVKPIDVDSVRRVLAS